MLDIIEQAGPRALTMDVPLDVRKEVATSSRFKDMLDMAATITAERFRARDKAIQEIGKENHQTEWKAADGLGEISARIPHLIMAEMQAKYGRDCWSDDGFIAAFLRDNPQFKVRARRGTRGQEY